VARNYAGFLGLVAFVAVIAQGFIHGAGTQTTLFHAWLSLLVFVVIGYVLGAIAAWVVDDAIASRVSAELAAARGAKAPQSAAKSKPA
jgi:ABC-type transport system involved in cytochrome bd biosynthesis fused ATPase/permease subunit